MNELWRFKKNQVRGLDLVFRQLLVVRFNLQFAQRFETIRTTVIMLSLTFCHNRILRMIICTFIDCLNFFTGIFKFYILEQIMARIQPSEFCEIYFLMVVLSNSENSSWILADFCFVIFLWKFFFLDSYLCFAYTNAIIA